MSFHLEAQLLENFLRQIMPLTNFQAAVNEQVELDGAAFQSIQGLAEITDRELAQLNTSDRVIRFRNAMLHLARAFDELDEKIALCKLLAAAFLDRKISIGEVYSAFCETVANLTLDDQLNKLSAEPSQEEPHA